MGASGAACGARAGVSQRSAAQFPWYLPRRVASHFLPSDVVQRRGLSLLTISGAADKSSDRSSNQKRIFSSVLATGFPDFYGCFLLGPESHSGTTRHPRKRESGVSLKFFRDDGAVAG